ncbi:MULTISPECIES: hypothetical protein [unclassified Microcoleus]|uniref:hypothetical protein n=1 Tax=unclassified Microcoleus TaxID=2642155 RepID=UPI002FD1CBBB
MSRSPHDICHGRSQQGKVFGRLELLQKSFQSNFETGKMPVIYKKIFLWNGHLARSYLFLQSCLLAIDRNTIEVDRLAPNCDRLSLTSSQCFQYPLHFEELVEELVR